LGNEGSCRTEEEEEKEENIMNFYNYLYYRLLEHTPSKKELEQGQYGSQRPEGWAGKATREEDKPGLNPGSRRVKISKRKNIPQGLPLSGRHGLQRLKRLKSSPVLQTGSEQGALAYKIEKREERGEERQDKKMYLGRPSRKLIKRDKNI